MKLTIAAVIVNALVSIVIFVATVAVIAHFVRKFW